MKTTITSREYDGAGNVTRETVTEYETPISATSACVCGQPWHSVLPRYCPVHGSGHGGFVQTTTATPQTYTINRNTTGELASFLGAP